MAVTEDLNLFADMKKKKAVMNTDNINMHHFYAFLIFQLYLNRDCVLISNSKKEVYTAV